MSRKARLDFFFDVVSPFSCIAHEALKQYASRLPVQLHYRPAFLPGIFRGAKNTGPIQHPLKAIYTHEQVERLGRYWKITGCSLPKTFDEDAVKLSSITAQRVVTAIQKDRPDHFLPLTDALFSRLFVQHLPNHRPEDVLDALQKIGLGADSKKILERANHQEIKDLLKATNDELLNTHNGFGLPWLVLSDPEKSKAAHFFGVESFPQLCHELNIKFEGPLKH